MACSLGANWPETLNSCVTNSKVRDQPAGFEFSDVNSGPPFLQMYSEDLPTFWDVKFVFDRDDARLFSLWLAQNEIRTKSPWFEFPIQIEEGLTTQEVRFLTYPQNITQVGGVFSYTAKIMAREIASKDSDCPEGVTYILLNKGCNTTFDNAANCFGEAINEAWPS